MTAPLSQAIVTRIVARAVSLGASLAGIVGVAALKASPSHRAHRDMAWSAGDQSVLVLALAHPEIEPELDWWGVSGGSAGNHRLQLIAESLECWLKEELDIEAHALSYQPGKRGIFLKDAATLAGLGCIGTNNLLVTPEFGPRVRLRAVLLNVQCTSAGPPDFSPCDACGRSCWQACPWQAFASGSYSRLSCSHQMQEDVSSAGVVETIAGSPVVCVKYCRACELSCPVGSQRAW